MRQKAFYTKDEIFDNLYTTGAEWMTEDAVEYKGLYHTYSTGETYTQGEWNPNTSVKLIPYEYIEPNAKAFKELTKIEVKYDDITPRVVNITQQTREDGFVYRYFIKKVNANNIIEIDSEQYNAWLANKIDKNMYVATEIVWSIAGTRNTETVNGAIVTGVVESNLQRIQTAERIIPGISSKLTNPLEYYSDTDITVPRDINA